MDVNFCLLPIANAIARSAIPFNVVAIPNSPPHPFILSSTHQIKRVGIARISLVSYISQLHESAT
ncbi:hypothetical protein [Moorena producens]|uniref:hypothetical protein n=1 Tax=Moorena producens TaxID=1155739 RepID=UPI003C73DF3A